MLQIFKKRLITSVWNLRMKNLLAKFLLLLALYVPLEACSGDAWLEARAAYIHPTGGRFNKIYNDSGSYGGKLTVSVWDDLQGWLSVDGYSLKGKSIGLGTGTDLNCVPVGLGLQYMFPCWPLCSTDLYVGAGVDCSFFSIHDNGPYVIEKINHTAWGARFLGGAIINCSESFFFDVFVEYTLSRIDYNHGFVDGVYTSSAEVSHINAGVGIGYRFNLGNF